MSGLEVLLLVVAALAFLRFGPHWIAAAIGWGRWLPYRLRRWARS